jgi:hypothetical protein
MKSEANEIAGRYCKDAGLMHEQPQLQFFLNDLSGNGINNLFDLIEHFKNSMAKNQLGEAPPPSS